jgi:HD-GYP domain-containing protein (c-di-GMP phosphodiesterase class II)
MADHLTSDRPYRKAWTKDAVIAYLQENAGKIYDPEIVNVFLTII